MLWIPTVSIFVPDLLRGQQHRYKRVPYRYAAAAGGGSCPDDSSPDVTEDATQGPQHFGLNTDHWYSGQLAYNDGTERTICKIGFKLNKVGDISGVTYKSEIFTLTGNNLNTQIANGTSDGILGGAWTSTWVYFSFPGNPVMAASTSYGIVIRRDGSADASNYARHYNDETEAGTLTGTYATWNSVKVIEYNPGGTDDASLKIFWFD